MRLLLFTVLSLIVPLSNAEAQQSITLSEFFSQVRKESPDLAVEKANIDAAIARASGIRISPPMIGYMQMKEGGSTRDGLEIAQEIPFPTKVVQDKKVRGRELEAQKEGSSYQRSLILAQAREAYIASWIASERLEILKEKHSWLKHHVKLTRAATRSESTAQIHLLEIESEADLIENDIVALEADVTQKKNGLRIYAPSLKVESITLQKPPLMSVNSSAIPANSSLVTWKEKELASKEALEGLKKQAYVPDLFVRYRNFEGNEIEPRNQELMVGVSVPFLYFWQPRAEIAEASAEKMKAEANLQRSRVEFESRLASLLKKLESIQTQLSNLNEKLLPRAERSQRLVTASISPRTMEGLDQHRAVMLAYLDLRLKAVELRFEYENNLQEVLKLTGSNKVVGEL